MIKFRQTILILIVLFFSFSVSAATFQPFFSGHNKMDVNIRNLWKKAMNSGELTDRINCIVRLENSVNEALIRELKNSGFKVKITLRSVVTGNIEIGNLPLLVALKEVKAIEGESQLGLK